MSEDMFSLIFPLLYRYALNELLHPGSAVFAHLLCNVTVNVERKSGGVTLYNGKKTTMPIGVFIPYSELNSLRNKVVSYGSFSPLSDIVSGRTPYLFTDLFHTEHPEAEGKLSKGHLYDISSNAFESLPEVFTKEIPTQPEQYFKVLGRIANQRAYLWILRKYARGRNEEYTTKKELKSREDVENEPHFSRFS